MYTKHYDINRISNPNLSMLLLDLAYTQLDMNWSIYKEHPAFNRLYFITDGEGIIEAANETVRLQPGTFYLVPAQYSFRSHCPDTLSKYFIHFIMELYPGIDLFDQTKKILSAPFSLSRLDAIFKHIEKGKLMDALILKSFLHEMIALLIDDTLEAVIKLRYELGMQYETIFKAIENECTAELSVKQLAARMDLTPQQLSKQFKKETGFALKELMVKKLVQRAKQYLLYTDMPIKEIAKELKFCDAFYFSNFVKKHLGFSPTTYRK
jgi:AraC-like DNA-binding protein